VIAESICNFLCEHPVYYADRPTEGRANRAATIDDRRSNNRAGLCQFRQGSLEILFDYGLDPPGSDRLCQRRVISLCLIGIGQGELGQRLIKQIPLAQIAANRGGVARFSMRTVEQCSAACSCAIDR
jgi:hypothetical protein